MALVISRVFLLLPPRPMNKPTGLSIVSPIPVDTRYLHQVVLSSSTLPTSSSPAAWLTFALTWISITTTAKHNTNTYDEFSTRPPVKMAGFLIPPWYHPYGPTESDLVLATFVWGFTFALAICVFAKGVKQTHRCFRRCHFWNPYIIMVWVEWAACLGVAASSWLFLRGVIQPRYVRPVYLHLGVFCLCEFLLMQSGALLT